MRSAATAGRDEDRAETEYSREHGRSQGAGQLVRSYVAAALQQLVRTGSRKLDRRPVRVGDGAGEGIRTLDVNLGKVALYH